MKRSNEPSTPGNWIVTIPRADGRAEYIAAPAGWMRLAAGGYEYDGSVGCEVTDKIEHAYHFSRRAAERQAVPACGKLVLLSLLNRLS